MGDKIKFAVVGLGQIGKRHADMIKQHPQTELGAVVDTDASLAAIVEKDYGVPFYDSIHDMAANTDGLDIANICTPNGLHAAQAVHVLEHNMHVVCEKPMGLNKAECESLISKSLEMNKKVFCVMQNRYSSPSVWLKSIVDSGQLGEIYMVQINCYWNRGAAYYDKSSWKGSLELDGGPLFTQFSHFVDIMFWLFGDIKNIQAKFANYNHEEITEFEDSGFVKFDFIKGGLGSFNYSTAVFDKNFESSLIIIAENGTVKVGGQYMEDLVYCHVKDYKMPELEPVNPPNQYEGYTGSAANHHFVIQNVIDALLGDSSVTTNALEGLKVVDIIERIYTHRTAVIPTATM